MNIAGAVSVIFAEGIMIQAPRFSRTVRGERRAAHTAAEHHLLDQDGTFLGRIDASTEPPVFGPLAPTIYLRRDRARGRGGGSGD